MHTTFCISVYVLRNNSKICSGLSGVVLFLLMDVLQVTSLVFWYSTWYFIVGFGHLTIIFHSCKVYAIPTVHQNLGYMDRRTQVLTKFPRCIPSIHAKTGSSLLSPSLVPKGSNKISLAPFLLEVPALLDQVKAIVFAVS